MEQEQIVDAVRDWLDGDDWHYEYGAETRLLKMGINLKSKIKSGRIFVDIKDDCYAVYLCAPISGDKENLGELLKYIAMANYGLLNGNFEVDVRDGEIRYKTFVNCDGLDSLSPEVIKDSIYIGCVMMDRYGHCIPALARACTAADTEIKKAEHQDDEASDD